MTQAKVRTFRFNDDGTIPNNPELPVLLYPGVLKASPGETEAVFNRHGWLNSWTNGVYAYHHYHSNAHEVLGVIRGSAVLRLGGESGDLVELAAGDVVVLPAGTGHRRLSSSDDFRIVGAYPEGMSCNLRTGAPDERAQDLQAIRQVPLPATDPVYGTDGPLPELWGGRKPAAE